MFSSSFGLQDTSAYGTLHCRLDHHTVPDRRMQDGRSDNTNNDGDVQRDDGDVQPNELYVYVPQSNNPSYASTNFLSVAPEFGYRKHFDRVPIGYFNND